MASSSKRSWSLSSLPPEITQEIFYKTPTDVLVRSKPTCKKWYALITDETFIYEHLRRSQERFIRIFDGVVQIMDPVLTRERSASPIQNEFQPPPYEIDTMVHCDGLMLCKWVEPVGVITSSDYYGIGYSNSKKKARDDGYKIVRFTCGLEGNYEINVVPLVEIYEFKTNSWRTTGVKVDADVKITRKCVAVMGNMYWIAYKEEEEEEEEEFIRCFDFSDETFKDVCPI
ncbi:hypothetical protein F2Q68_00002797 [Brassica cretica]|uniref:F-box domain-containing protein n=1 Tax=Brassica cretica TaxID=69181 RepID=A0A8S9JDV3_BRACR|nr:hypothetical protein F2Q68_00002797 [Brassica cretica]